MPKSRGFTLIELLITISIIAILSAIGMVAYSVVLKQGRDSKRQSDLRSIQSALEQYYADQFYYPQDNIFSGSSLRANGKTYLNTIPTDPTGSLPYDYSPFYLAPPASPVTCNNAVGSSNKCNYYCLYANLENSNPGKGTCTDTRYNFAVTPP